MIVNQRCPATHCERSREPRVCREIQPRLDFAGEFVTQVEKPATLERQTARLEPDFFFAPALIERIEKANPWLGNQRFTGRREQDVVAPQRAAGRGALQQEGITRWIVAMQLPQIPGTCDLANCTRAC